MIFTILSLMNFLTFLITFVAIHSSIQICLANSDITVGPNFGFHPNITFGNSGELINFHFEGNGFSISETKEPFHNPCNSKEGNFDSGIRNKGNSYSIEITSQKAIYIFSKNQCKQGFVMIVNPPSKDSIEKYHAAAKASQ